MAENSNPGVYCEVCGACILEATMPDGVIAATDFQPAITAHQAASGHYPAPLFIPNGTYIQYNPFNVSQEGKGSRSTPEQYQDTDHVWDAHGQLWCYSEPSDVWMVRDTPTRAALVVPTSARSYQRLEAEFGPLRRDSAESEA